MDRLDRQPQDAAADGIRDTRVRNLIGYNLKRSYMLVRSSAEAALAPHELRVVSMTALSLIVDNPGISPSQIADALQMERPNIVVIIDELEARDLVDRARSTTDRRRYALTATLKGRRLRDRATADAAAAEDRAISALTAEEKELLLALLKKVRRDSE
ncbi:MAG: MarR family transcriptional regulator [Paracoccus sp. (in: a-proteobacteria)]|nr:MarR family transcriptional regulator [Paracoccus sp. (in: a-proteobacteria)]